MRLTPLALLIALTTIACSGDKGDGTDSGTATDGADGADGNDGGDGDDGDDGGSSIDCPDEVPERFRNSWDCSAEACGAPVLYRYATGSSTPDTIELQESYFMFSGGGEWCVDTFTVTGEASPIDPATFNCSECEQTWETTWNMSTGNSCGLVWGSLFERDSSEAEGPFYGFLMFETHGALSGRNPDFGALVIAATADSPSGALSSNPNWAEGTSTPSTGADEPPEDYEYWSDPMCTARATAGGPHGRPDILDALRLGESAAE